ncbi:hypothetical protein KJ632_03300 [Patescibacteria group bacterium]|nr:hypothetical protein [Patescibacteria group bacterium]
MDKRAIVQFTHNMKSLLTLDSALYKQWVFRYTFLELEKDLGIKGDISTKFMLENGEMQAKYKFVTKSEGVLAGLEELRYFLVESDADFKPQIKGKLDLKLNFKDGDKVKAGDVIGEISGNAADILAVERVCLNLIMRMSSVATHTAALLAGLGDSPIILTPTRKTLWGLLDKKAVSFGGGGTHRLNLSDSIIIKDTHLDLFNDPFVLIGERLAEAEPDVRFFEVEVSHEEGFLRISNVFGELLRAGKMKAVPVIMFDNFTPADIRAVLDVVKGSPYFDSIIYEASGGVNGANLKEYAGCGVDVVSMSDLCLGAGKFDVSLKVG